VINTILIHQLPRAEDGTQQFAVWDARSRWDGWKLGYCVEPGHYAVHAGIVPFEITSAGTFDDCTHYRLENPDHQNVYVTCQTVEPDGTPTPEQDGGPVPVSTVSTMYLMMGLLILVAVRLRRKTNLVESKWQIK